MKNLSMKMVYTRLFLLSLVFSFFCFSKEKEDWGRIAHYYENVHNRKIKVANFSYFYKLKYIQQLLIWFKRKYPKNTIKNLNKLILANEKELKKQEKLLFTKLSTQKKKIIIETLIQEKLKAIEKKLSPSLLLELFQKLIIENDYLRKVLTKEKVTYSKSDSIELIYNLLNEKEVLEKKIKELKLVINEYEKMQKLLKASENSKNFLRLYQRLNQIISENKKLKEKLEKEEKKTSLLKQQLKK